MRMSQTKVWCGFLILLLLGLLALGCQTMEQKRDKFLQHGQELYDKGDYVRARLQFKNALQIDPKFAPAILWLAKTEMKLENFKGAFGLLNQVLELDPNLVEARVLLGRIYLGAKKFEEAQAQIKEALQREPKNTDALMLEASLAYIQGKFPEAKGKLAEIKQLDAKKYEVYLLAAQIEASQKNFAEADQILAAGMQAIPDKKELYLARASLADAQGEFFRGEQYLLEAVKLEPKNPALQAQLAQHYIKSQEFDKAEQALRQQLTLEPENEKHVIALARFLLGRNRAKEAEQEIVMFVEKNPDNKNARFALADFYLSRRQEGRAIKTLQAIVEADPTSAPALQAKGRLAAIHAARGRTAEAERLASEVIKENPKDMAATRTLGLLALNKRDGLTAVNNFRLIVNDQPQDPEARLLLARAHLVNNEKEQAREQAKKALELKPDYFDARRFLYGMYLQDKDYQGAIDTIQGYLRYNDKDLFNLAALGEVYALKGDLAAARATYKKMIAIDPKNPQGYFEMARLELRQNKPEAALPWLNDALAQNPIFLPALQILTGYYLEKNQPQKAEEIVQKSLAGAPDNPILLQMLGELALLQRKPQEAAKYLEKAFALNPRQLGALRLLVLAYEQSPDQDKVAEELAKKASDPKAPRFYALAEAMYYERLKDYTKAMEAYNRMIERNLFATLAKNNLAYLLVNHLASPENNQKALQLVTEALDEAPEDPNILDTKGWILYQLGDYQQALTFLQQAVDFGPENPAIKYHLAATLAKLGESAQATDILEKLLETKVKFADRVAAETLLLQLRAAKPQGKP